MANTLRSKDFKTIGIYSNKTISIAMSILSKKEFKKFTNTSKLTLIQKIKLTPDTYLNDKLLSPIAREFEEPDRDKEEPIQLLETAMELTVFGRPLIKDNAFQQMKTAMKLPIVHRGALMPDSHLGYGLPIGAALATQNAIIPFAIGMDIGCRMSLTIYEATDRFFKMHAHKFKQSIINNTAFGLTKTVSVGANEHAFLDRDVFKRTALLSKLKSKAAKQLGSSGSGNHFVEWGIVEVTENDELSIPKGQYIGLMAHSGSRGFGASVAKFYSDLAKNESSLPHKVRHLAWLDLNKDNGREYWMSMNLAGDYAKACHDQIHKNVAKPLGLKPVLKIENHHNFAWKEIVDGKEMIVHRKGSTPAGKGVLGLIPGSMTDPGVIVTGKGNTAAMNSVSHGAGRKCSRKETISRNTKSEMRKELRNKNVTLIGGALDESPYAYKSLEKVMSYQSELVDIIGKFYPRIVRMDRDK